MNIFFINLGCKVNQYETECLKEAFLSEDYSPCSSCETADVIVINTCTVTCSGGNRSLHALKNARKSAPDAVIVLTGCLPQTDKQPESSFPEADIVTGTKNRKEIPALVKSFIENREKRTCVYGYGSEDEFEDLHCCGFEKTRAFLKIQDGCDQFCSYCIIPYARGRCRSKPIDALVSEVEALVKNGHREIVLVGINLAFYGKELGLRLIDAVESCCSVPGVERVRLGSLEPEMISDSDLSRLAALPQFCPQFHLSLQSGCDRTLKAMNRRYTCEEYYQLVTRIRSYFPDCAITTDIMVGFPGESEEDFLETMKFAEKIGFAKIHVFPYSLRPGTAAAKMKGHLPERIKTERMKKLKALGDKLSEKFHKSLVGRTFPVLFEKESDRDHHRGHTPNCTLIKINEKNFEKSLKREIFCVKIIEGKKDCCIGEIVK